jgi:hypothetical protein
LKEIVTVLRERVAFYCIIKWILELSFDLVVRGLNCVKRQTFGRGLNIRNARELR